MAWKSILNKYINMGICKYVNMVIDMGKIWHV